MHKNVTHYYTYDRVIEAAPGAFNKYEYEQIRVGPCHTELEAWEKLPAQWRDNPECRLVWTDDGLPVQTWSGSRPRRIAA